MNTIYLSPSTWDLVADVNGNIAMATNPYAQAQDAATAIKTFLGECYYNTTLGVAWWNILGQLPPINYVKAQLVAAALTVPGVTKAVVYITSFTARALTGQVQITTDDGLNATANF